MKIVFATLLSAVGACTSFAGSAVKIAHFRVDISPEVGCNICGYPDNLDEPLVRIPGGVKETNFRFNEEKKR